MLYRKVPTIDPAKAEAARSVAAKLMPAGTMRRLLTQPLNMKVIALVYSYSTAPVERLAQEMGARLPEEGRDGPPMVRIRLREIIDPAAEQRIAIAHPIIAEAAAVAAERTEPKLREALALAYSERMTLAELHALDRFLSTPDGAAFVRATADLEADLDVFSARQTLDAATIDAVAASLPRIEQAAAALPKIRSLRDLTPGERAEAAQLLGVATEERQRR